MKITFADAAYDIVGLNNGIAGIKCWTDEATPRELRFHITRTWMDNNGWDTSPGLVRALEERRADLLPMAQDAFRRGSVLVNLVA